MHSVCEPHDLGDRPLGPRETVSFWRDRRLAGTEFLSATFLNYAFSPHSHETLSIGTLEAGRQNANIRGNRTYSGPGDLYLINADEIHDGAPAENGYRYRMIYPDPDFLRGVIEDVTGQVFSGTPSFSSQMVRDPGLAAAFLDIHRRLEDGVGTLEAGETMFSVLAAVFRRHGSALNLAALGQESVAMRRVRDLLVSNIERDIGLEELAKEVRLSRAHMIRAFRREYHITPHAFLTNLRIGKARKMLVEGVAVADVAFACGFADQAHFTRSFKAALGVTPGRFRTG